MIKKIGNFFKRKYSYFLLKKNKNVEIKKKSYVNSNTFFEGYNRVHSNAFIFDCFIGTGSYIGEGCHLTKVKVGRYCSIAPNVKVIDGNHPTRNFVSTHPSFFRVSGICGLKFNINKTFDEYSFVDIEKNYYCEIGNDVWIGHSVSIMNGIKIGDGAIIAAGSIVTKNVEPYSIVGGVPAKFIRYRFEPSQINALLSIKWWDWRIGEINSRAFLFSDINAFIDKYYNLNNS